jgi:ABC-type transport system involved in cytochrome bd biosynthesis fused ATPase/permease subunit
MVVSYDNDSVRARTMQFTARTSSELRINNPEGWVARGVSGFFYIPADNDPQRLCIDILNRISLIRFHKSPQWRDRLNKPDSVQTDTLQADTLAVTSSRSAGAITLDGVDIRRFATHDLRALMGIVCQEPVLFNDTVYNNITFGVDTTQPAPNGMSWQQAVEQAARIANAHQFITDMPEGYDTVIGDRGSRLSGGQRQRLSIARAILKNSPILILDEATSALDTESEKLVQEALEHLMAERTTLVVAHRLSTIKHADLICVLHEGQIVERGTHEDLYKLGGYYTKLVDMQQ